MRFALYFNGFISDLIRKMGTEHF